MNDYPKSRDIKRDAILSPCGQHRYLLTRSWKRFHNVAVTLVMLNPSVGDGRKDDPTIRRCIRFAHEWGYSRIHIVNLFSYISSNPHDLHIAQPQVLNGPDAEFYFRQALNLSFQIVVGWGGNPITHKAPRQLGILEQHRLFCLGTTKHGYPRHPLYLSYDTPLRVFYVSERSLNVI